jgi:hypothetical protein
MSDSGFAQQASPIPILPLFYKEVLPLDRGRHAGLRLDRSKGYGFAALANAIPLALAEIETAAMHYPVVFAVGNQAMPLAILGYRDNENLFLDAGGQWRERAYVPAYARAYPFILVQPSPESEQVLVAIDPSAACLSSSTGESLFGDDGAPGPVLNAAMALCNEYNTNLRETQHFVTALQEANLLVPQKAELEFVSGEHASLEGFQCVDAMRLRALPDATFLALRAANFLPAIYACQQSTRNWGSLVRVAGARRPAAAG